MRLECEEHYTPARDNRYRATARYYVDSCPYCEIDRLKVELESKDKAIKLLQGHCNALMDTEGKLAQWKKGHTAGQEAAGYYQKQADDMIRQLRKELSDENANFTEEIMNLERQLAEARAEVRQVEQSAINFHEAWQQALNDLESARNDRAEALTTKRTGKRSADRVPRLVRQPSLPRSEVEA